MSKYDTNMSNSYYLLIDDNARTRKAGKRVLYVEQWSSQVTWVELNDTAAHAPCLTSLTQRSGEGVLAATGREDVARN